MKFFKFSETPKFFINCINFKGIFRYLKHMYIHKCFSEINNFSQNCQKSEISTFQNFSIPLTKFTLLQFRYYQFFLV